MLLSHHKTSLNTVLMSSSNARTGITGKNQPPVLITLDLHLQIFSTNVVFLSQGHQGNSPHTAAVQLTWTPLVSGIEPALFRIRGRQCLLLLYSTGHGHCWTIYVFYISYCLLLLLTDESWYKIYWKEFSSCPLNEKPSKSYIFEGKAIHVTVE